MSSDEIECRINDFDEPTFTRCVNSCSPGAVNELLEASLGRWNLQCVQPLRNPERYAAETLSGRLETHSTSRSHSSDERRCKQVGTNRKAPVCINSRH